jgi:hypothetical protein
MFIGTVYRTWCGIHHQVGVIAVDFMMVLIRF